LTQLGFLWLVRREDADGGPLAAHEEGFVSACGGASYTIGEDGTLAFGNDEKLTLTVQEKPSPGGSEPLGKLT